jgi:hypothetical protein
MVILSVILNILYSKAAQSWGQWLGLLALASQSAVNASGALFAACIVYYFFYT